MRITRRSIDQLMSFRRERGVTSRSAVYDRTTVRNGSGIYDRGGGLGERLEEGRGLGGGRRRCLPFCISVTPFTEPVEDLSSSAYDRMRALCLADRLLKIKRLVDIGGCLRADEGGHLGVDLRGYLGVDLGGYLGVDLGAYI